MGGRSMEEGSTLACLWAGCTAGSFASDRLLDEHVEATHVKTKKSGGGKSDKGVVCEWKDCLSDKIYRDSWNLVTHMRYKHTHYRPYVCPNHGCGKAFVQLHQMKKHSKTPHDNGSAGRGRKRVDRRRDNDGGEDNDADYGGVSGGPPLQKPRAAPVDDNVVHEADKELAALGDGALDRFRAASPLELDAAAGLANASEDGATSPSMRLPGIVSPTSLLAHNTSLQMAAGRAALWSPLGFANMGGQGHGAGDRLMHGSTPTPPVLDEHPNTPVRGFTAQAPSSAFVPISSEPQHEMQRTEGTNGELAWLPVVVKPSRPLPSPLPAPMYK